MPQANDPRERLPGGRASARMSDRAFGAAFAAAFAVIGAVAWLASETLSAWLFVISGALLTVSFFTPGLLSPLNALRARLLDSATPPILRISPRIRLILWNMALIAAGLLLIALFGEGWLQLRTPFTENTIGWNRYSQETGLMNPPNTEIRNTNRLDYWTVTRTNKLGFLDRERPDPERAAASCHIAAIGDSFVEAIQVGVEDKFHVRLEEMATTNLPGLDVTTSAYGVRSTGQTHQLPWYDEYTRPLRPNLVILVFVNNDIVDNSPALYAMKTGYGPDGIPYATARENPDGVIHLRPPQPGYARERLSSFQDYPLIIRYWRNTDSLLVHWLGRKIGLKTLWRMSPFHTRAEELVRRPGYESTLDGWDPADIADTSMSNFLTQPDPPPVFQEALKFTAFALDEFRRRTKRDGAELVILASHTMGRSGDPLFERVADMARELGIPVVNQSDYIARQGGKIEDARFAHDNHWSAQGHQWAAEALLGWLRENPQVCDDGDDA